MIKISVLLIVCVLLAWLSEKRTNNIRSRGYHDSLWNDKAYILLVLILSLFAGLRTQFNDTQNYIRGFGNAGTLAEFLSHPENLNPFRNPLFYAYQSFLKEFTDNGQVLIFTTALFSQICIVRFLKRYSHDFAFSIFLYFTLGTFSLTLAAIKQVVAMAILTLAFPHLQKRQWFRYHLVVFIAMLVHTYAISFCVLPLFIQKPWKLFTYLFVAAMVVLMMNFEETITEFMEQANELGKSIAEYEVFDDQTINVFRLAVYAVTPLISFIFKRLVNHNSSDTDNVLVHMSIISLAFMSMGTQSGANMFGRMANYFELGTICCLPWMLEQTFEKRSYRLVAGFAVVCFLGFFIYANGINSSFDQGYQATSIMRLIIP